VQPLPELAFPRPETFLLDRRPAYTPRFGEKAGELERGLPSVIATVFAAAGLLFGRLSAQQLELHAPLPDDCFFAGHDVVRRGRTRCCRRCRVREKRRRGIEQHCRD